MLVWFLPAVCANPEPAQRPASGPIQTFASLCSTRPSKCLNHKDH